MEDLDQEIAEVDPISDSPTPETDKEEGADDSEDALIAKIEKLTKKALRAIKNWREAAKDDYRFALGAQWTTEEIDQLKNEGRPCLTFNKIEPLVDLVVGYEIENSMRIRVNPEGGEDQLFADVGDRIVKAIDKWTKLSYKLSQQFEDGLIGGEGLIEMAISYDEDIINGDLIFRLLSPIGYPTVVFDPNSREYDLSDCGYAVKLSKLEKTQLIDLFPKKKAEIKGFVHDVDDYVDVSGMSHEGDTDNYHLGKDPNQYIDEMPDSVTDPSTEEKYLLKELWEKRKDMRYFVFNVNDNRLERYDTREEAEAKKNEILGLYEARNMAAMTGYQALTQPGPGGVSPAEAVNPGQPPKPPTPMIPDVKVIEKSVFCMYYSASACGVVLQEEIKSPLEPYFHGFPFFPFKAKWRPNVGNKDTDQVLKLKGIVRNIKDPQKELNKSRSQFLHILNTSANSGWIDDDDALTPEGWKDLEKIGSTPGVVIQKRKDRTLERISPVSMSAGHVRDYEQSGQDIKDISGVNADALAIQDKNTSGRAIALRIKQAVTILSPYFRNFRFTKEMIGTAIFAMIPHIFDKNQIKKIVGQDFMTKNGIDDGYLDAFLTQIQDGKYDVVITEADNSASIRSETFDQLTELAKAGMPIPPDVILEFSSVPNSGDIIKRIQAAAQPQPGAPGAAPVA